MGIPNEIHASPEIIPAGPAYAIGRIVVLSAPVYLLPCLRDCDGKLLVQRQ